MGPVLLLEAGQNHDLPFHNKNNKHWLYLINQNVWLPVEASCLCFETLVCTHWRYFCEESVNPMLNRPFITSDTAHRVQCANVLSFQSNWTKASLKV